MIRSTTPSWVASSASSSRPPPATSAIAPAGSPAASAASARDPRQHRVGVRGRRGAAQHDRVAGLQAQRRGVDRHVRPRLVDDGDDAERHAHLAHVEPVGEPAAVEHLADRVGQRGDRAHAVGDRRRRARASSASRSSSAADSPASRPASRSRALASRISGVRATSASAIACSAASLVAESSRASSREAALAARQMSATDGRRRPWSKAGQGARSDVGAESRGLRRARSSPGGRPPRPRAAAPRAPAADFMPITRRSSAAE